MEETGEGRGEKRKGEGETGGEGRDRRGHWVGWHFYLIGKPLFSWPLRTLSNPGKSHRE